jgi:hypothetical protein
MSITLLPVQQRFVDDTSPLKLLTGPRGAGKTTAAIAALRRIVEPRKTYAVCLLSPEYQVSNLVMIFGDELSQVLQRQRKLTLSNGARILWLTPFEWEDRLRGLDLAGIVLDDVDLYYPSHRYALLYDLPCPVKIMTSSSLTWTVRGASVTSFDSWEE